MGIFLMSINSVVISPRFDTSPKTKFAAGSVNRPRRGVPIMIGRKTGRVTSSAAILRFVEEAEEAYKRNLWRKANAARVVSTATRWDWRNWQTRQRGIPKWPIS